MRSPLRKLLAPFVLVLFAWPLPSSRPRSEPAATVSPVDVMRGERDIGPRDAENALRDWYEWAGSLPAPMVAPTKRKQTYATAAATYEPGSIEDLICDVFTEDCPRAIRVARCESGLNPSARNPSGASGLFQLLGHGDMFEAHGWPVSDVFDAYKNTVVAHDLWAASGWAPWVCG